MHAAKLLVMGLVVSVPAVALAAERHIPESKVPKAVVEAVKQKYPSAKATGYEEEKEDGKVNYEVDLQNGAQEMEVELSADGKVLAEEVRVEPKDVPEAVTKALQSSPHGKGKVEKAEKVTLTDKPGAEFYELYVAEGAKRTQLLFDKEGKLVKQSQGHEPRGEAKREAEKAVR